MRHFLRLRDLSRVEANHLLDRAGALKADLKKGIRPALLPQHVLGMVFEKPSLRTRASFEAAMAQLGGTSLFFNSSDGIMGQREPVSDFARALSSYVDIVVLRTFKHTTIEEFARHSRVPVINGLSDESHPCQALGDFLTMREALGDTAGKTVVFVGDGNNVARSLATGCGLFGMRFVLACPPDYSFDKKYLASYRRLSPRGQLLQESDPVKAVKEADILYTDVWTSMGQEAERKKRCEDFAPYQLNEKLLAKAPKRARVLHCLPAIRGEEITDGVLESKQSIVFEQAENRMHAQKAVLLWLLQS